MPFARPTLTQLIERGRDDLNGRLPGADSRLRRSALDVLAAVHAGAVHGLYGHLDYAARQLMPDTADAEHLDRWASVWGVTRKAAEPATGDVSFTGTNGSEVEAGTVLQRGDEAEYLTAEDVTIALGVATVAVTAVVPGAGGAALAGVLLTFASPAPGVAAEATVAVGGLTGGADQESDDSLRERLLERIRNQPRGGAASDYVRWAKEVAGVTRAWCYPEMDGLGTVGVAFVMDAREDIIPEAGDVTAVRDYIEERRPVTALFNVFAPTPVPLALTIDPAPDSAEIRAAIEAELLDLLAREAEPGGTILLSHIREAISGAAGEEDHDLVAPVADVTHAPDEIAVLGTITWS